MALHLPGGGFYSTGRLGGLVWLAFLRFGSPGRSYFSVVLMVLVHLRSAKTKETKFSPLGMFASYTIQYFDNIELFNIARPQICFPL